MQSITNLFITEENIIREYLLKAGYSNESIDIKLNTIKSTNPTERGNRNLAISEVADVLKSRVCALRPYYVHELISKISGLSTTTITIYANSVKPDSLIYNRRKNKNQNL